jgi:hypothetical protein
VVIEFSLLIDGVDWSCRTLVNWTVQIGRQDADTQPGPGRGEWVLSLDGADRAASVTVGSKVEFRADVNGAVLPVATMTVMSVVRGFSWGGPGARNEVTISASGPSAILQRTYLPHTFAVQGPGGEETDGSRVYRAVGLAASIPLPPRRTQAGHIVQDLPPMRAWNASVVSAGSSWSSLQRAPVTGTGVIEGELRFTSDRGVAVRRAGKVWVFPTAGSHVVVDQSRPPFDCKYEFTAWDPLKAAVPWTDGDKVTSPPDHFWTSVTGTWEQSVVSGTVNISLTGFDAWDLGTNWDWGQDRVCWRWNSTSPDPSQENAGLTSALAHIQEVAGAVRGVLWEGRDGSVYYQSRLHRTSPSPIGLFLNACDIVTPVTSTVDADGLVNRCVQEYSYPDWNNGGKRSQLDVADAASVSRHHGEFMRSNNGPILDRATAQAVCDQILAAHADPHERLEGVTLLDPGGPLPDSTVASLLRAPLGSLVKITGAPGAGWLGSSWTGWLEGVTLTGKSRSVAGAALNLSDFYNLPGRAAVPSDPLVESSALGSELASLRASTPVPGQLQRSNP